MRRDATGARNHLAALLFAGLTLDSDIALPELAPSGSAATPGIKLRHSFEPIRDNAPVEQRHDWNDPAGHSTLAYLRRDQTDFLHLPAVADARLDNVTTVTAHKQPQATRAAFRHALLDQILPRVLAGDGELMLHAAAVTDDKAGTLVLLADSGQGKSTLCAALAHAGATLLSDDCLRIIQTGDSVEAIPTYSGLRLLPDSLVALYGDDAPATTPVADYTSKRRLSHAADAGIATRRSAPVDAAIILQPPGDNPEIRLRRLPPADATIALVRNSFALDPTDMAHMQRILAKATDAANNVPVYALTYPRDYTRLPDVIAHLQNLPRHQVT